MISMLLPARGRTANLYASVDSVYSLASHPENVEVLVRMDDDDKCLQDEQVVLADIAKHVGRDLVRVEVGPRLGYARMHEYYNDLAARARGDWLFIWNDDIEMLTEGWDEKIADAPLFSVQFPRRDMRDTTDYTLPVVGRPVYESVGHLSLNAYCDAWISDVSAFAGTSVIRNDVVFLHHRLDDETLREQAGASSEWAKFVTEEQRALRRCDMEKILSSPLQPGRFEGWFTEVEYHPVDYINLMEHERRAQSVVLKGIRP